MVLLRELKLTNVEFDYSVKAFPTFTSTGHSHLAPLGKIPALTVQDSSEAAPKVLFGSQVIAQYLDSISPDQRKALPASGSFERFEALTLEGLADGVCEAALDLRYERLERVSTGHHVSQRCQLTTSIAEYSLPNYCGKISSTVNFQRLLELYHYFRNEPPRSTLVPKFCRSTV